MPRPNYRVRAVRPVVRQALLLLALLSGCSTAGLFTKARPLAEVWSEQLGKYRITPVFPPGEDFQIGDVLVACAEPASPTGIAVPGEQPVPLRVLRLVGVAEMLSDYYEGSVKLLPDPATKALAPVRGWFKLKNLSLPEFFQVKASGSQLGGLLPFGTTLAGFGLSSSDVDSVDVSIPSAGSAALPLFQMQALVDSQLKGAGADDASPFGATGSVALIAQYQATCPTKRAKMVVVSEIYAAYAITLSVTLSKSTAASAALALSLPSDSTRQASFAALKDYFVSAPTKVSESAGTPAQSASAAAATASSAAAAAKSAQSAASSAQAAAKAATAASAPASAASAAMSAASAAMQAASAAGDAASAASAAVAAISAPAGAASGAALSDRDDKFVASLNSLLKGTQDIIRTSHPGVTVGVYNGTSSGIRMDRKFAEPVIVGIRYLELANENGVLRLRYPPFAIAAPAAISF